MSRLRKRDQPPSVAGFRNPVIGRIQDLEEFDLPYQSEQKRQRRRGPTPYPDQPALDLPPPSRAAPPYVAPPLTPPLFQPGPGGRRIRHRRSPSPGPSGMDFHPQVDLDEFQQRQSALEALASGPEAMQLQSEPFVPEVLAPQPLRRPASAHSDVSMARSRVLSDFTPVSRAASRASRRHAGPSQLELEAKYNRDLEQGLTLSPFAPAVVSLSRIGRLPPSPVPERKQKEQKHPLDDNSDLDPNSPQNNPLPPPRSAFHRPVPRLPLVAPTYNEPPGIPIGPPPRPGDGYPDEPVHRSQEHDLLQLATLHNFPRQCLTCAYRVGNRQSFLVFGKRDRMKSYCPGSRCRKVHYESTMYSLPL